MAPITNHRRRTILVWMFLLGASLLGLALGVAPFDKVAAQPPGAPQVTIIPGQTITGAVTWDKAGSPYQVGGIVWIAPGAALTIAPGVEVQFASGVGAGMVIQKSGRLVADGTPTEPITFTGATKTPGSWQGLQFAGDAATPNTDSILRYATVEYAGGSQGNIAMEWAYPTISHCTIRYSSKYGIYGRVIAGPRISDTALENNADYAIYLHEADYRPEFEALTATGNGPSPDRNAIMFGSGTLHGAHLWPNAGLPYVLWTGMIVAADGELTIEPGVEVRVEDPYSIAVHGRLLALGTPQQPITFTGAFTSSQTPVPGFWGGLRFEGFQNAPSVGSRLDYVTVEYGGYGGGGAANIYANWAQVAIAHSTIRLSAKDGVYANYGADMVSVESSQIEANGVITTNYGVYNGTSDYPNFTVLSAPNNWWGDASGPTFGGPCTTGGSGSRVSAGVDFLPVLGSPTGEPPALAPGTALSLVLEPQRWYVPADNSTYAVIIATLRDGAGNPVAGRIIKATTTLGTVASSATTNAIGQAQLLVKSGTAGDAVVTASLDQTGVVCELARRATTTITFTPYELDAGLTPSSASPYTSAAISVGPQPLMQGAPAWVTVTLTSPYTVAVEVNASLGVAQSGIGMAFVLVDQWEAVRLEAGSTVTLSTMYTPLTWGHWCFQLAYAWHPASALGAAGEGTAVGTFAVLQNENGQTTEDLNNNSKPAQTTNAQQMRAAFGVSERHVELQNYGEETTPPSTPDPPKRNINQRISDMIPVSKEIDREMGGDPPSQDYRTIVQPVKPVMPTYVAGGPEELTEAQATTLNALFGAFADAIGYGRAVLAADDRYAGATEAHEYTWAAQQIAALLYYRQQTGLAYLRIADSLEGWLGVYTGDRTMSLSDAIALQQTLSTTGFTQDEIDRFHALGCTDAAIEWIRQAVIARDPADLAGSVRDYYAEVIEDYRLVGNLLAYPRPTFSQQVEGGLAAASAGAASANLAGVAGATETIEIGNPLTSTATIELRLRPLGMPANWAMSVSASTVTLASGAHVPVTVTVSAPSASAQGTTARLAIEGYVNGKLLGGVALNVVVPRYAVPGGYRVYLPLALK